MWVHAFSADDVLRALRKSVEGRTGIRVISLGNRLARFTILGRGAAAAICASIKAESVAAAVPEIAITAANSAASTCVLSQSSEVLSGLAWDPSSSFQSVRAALRQQIERAMDSERTAEASEEQRASTAWWSSSTRRADVHATFWRPELLNAADKVLSGRSVVTVAARSSTQPPAAKKAKLEPAATEADGTKATLPFLLIANSDFEHRCSGETSFGWDLILPWCAASKVWLSLVMRGRGKAVGLSELRALHTEMCSPMFPFDFPEVPLYKRYRQVVTEDLRYQQCTVPAGKRTPESRFPAALSKWLLLWEKPGAEDKSKEVALVVMREQAYVAALLGNPIDALAVHRATLPRLTVHPTLLYVSINMYSRGSIAEGAAIFLPSRDDIALWAAPHQSASHAAAALNSAALQAEPAANAGAKGKGAADAGASKKPQHRLLQMAKQQVQQAGSNAAVDAKKLAVALANGQPTDRVDKDLLDRARGALEHIGRLADARCALAGPQAAGRADPVRYLGVEVLGAGKLDQATVAQVLPGRRLVGFATSGGYSERKGRGVGVAYIRAEAFAVLKAWKEHERTLVSVLPTMSGTNAELENRSACALFLSLNPGSTHARPVLVSVGIKL
jgi:hypothetical protein